LQIQDLTLAYLNVLDAMRTLDLHRHGVGDLDSLPCDSLESFESQASMVLRRYAKKFPASRWALDVVPLWCATGLVVGLPESGITSASAIYMMCGVEARRHVGPEEAEEILTKIVGPDRGQEVTDSQIRQIAAKIDRSPSGVRRPHSWKNVFFWATHRRHSEFLFTVMIRLGEWISRGGTPYDAVYEEALKEEGRKNLSLIQVQTRARNAAVRRFLTEFYQHMQPEIGRTTP
jgi:hypothetical protein